MSKYKSASLFKDFLGIFFLGLSLFVLIALTSWYPQDPSFGKNTSQLMAVHNRGGTIGAYMSGGLAHLFGAGDFIFPLLTFLAGWALVCPDLRFLPSPGHAPPAGRLDLSSENPPEVTERAITGLCAGMHIEWEAAAMHQSIGY